MAGLGESTGAFLGLGAPYSDVDTSRFVVVAVPYEASVGGREGAKLGPGKILEASQQVEFFDEENFQTTARMGIATLEPSLPDTTPDAYGANLETLAGHLQRESKRAVYLGGEGSITYPLVRSYLNQYRDLTLLQFDAHPNLRSQYQGSRFGRMTVMNRLQNDLPITQVGIRSLSEEEANMTDKGKVTTLFAQDILSQPLKSEVIPNVLEGLSNHVYVSVDMSVFDPALCPGTNLPQPGGLGWQHVLDILKAVCRERDIVAMDVVETVPIAGHGVTEIVAARLIYKVMGYLGQFRQWPEITLKSAETT